MLLDLSRPLSVQLDRLVTEAPHAHDLTFLSQLHEAIRDAQRRAHARGLLAALPSLRSIEVNYEHATGDSGESYIDWRQAICTFADGRVVTFKDEGWCDDRRWLDGEDDALAALGQSHPGVDPAELNRRLAALRLGVDESQVQRVACLVWGFIYAHQDDALDGSIELAPLMATSEASAAPLPEPGAAATLPALFEAAQACGHLTGPEKAVLAGILDSAFRRANLDRIPLSPPDSHRFPDLRDVFANCELPDEETPDRIYLCLHPFDVKLQRTDEGLVCDIFSRDGELDPLASCYAFNEEATDG